MRVKCIPNANPTRVGIFQVWCPACRREHPITREWEFNGNLDRPTFYPSLLVHEIDHGPYVIQPRCHSFIEGGRIRFLPDCGHDKAGTTMDLPELEDWPE